MNSHAHCSLAHHVRRIKLGMMFWKNLSPFPLGIVSNLVPIVSPASIFDGVLVTFLFLSSLKE